jgi:tetratricopeptide (TPR) repeat protein
MRAFYRFEDWMAISHFDKALEIDSNFAVAALWQVLTITGGVNQLRARAARAWKLRKYLSPRDSAMLIGQFAIGPNYPGTSNMRELLAASLKSATLNFDRPEAWYDYGSWMYLFGRQFHDDWLERAIAALDKSIALNPQFGPTVHWRLQAALAKGDPSEIRRWARRNEEVNARGDFIQLDRLLVAAALGEKVTTEPTLPPPMWRWYLHTIAHGLPLEPVELTLRELIKTLPAGNPRDRFTEYMWTVAATRGRASSPPSTLVKLDAAFIIHVALVDTQFTSMAAEAVAKVERLADSAITAKELFYRDLLRVHTGDTSSARKTIARLTEMVRGQDPGGFPRVGRFGVCTRLIAAMVEARAPPRNGRRPALDSLEVVTRGGPGIELPTTLANLFVVRQRQALGEHSRAYESARRLPYHPSPFTVVATPALLREEGRLAATLGDTAAAVRAYRRYLSLRDDANDGPLASDVAAVRRELSTLLARR